MKSSITAMITQYLPKTQHQPRLLLKSNRSLVQLYTNYPCITGLSADVCAGQFNQNAYGLTAVPHGNFVNFMPSPDFIQTQIDAIAQTFHPAQEALPSADMRAYLHYVISVIAHEYPCDVADAPYTPQETELCIWILYLSEQSENHRQKRKVEFITRLSAVLKTYIFSQISQKQRQLLLAAASMLTPQA